MAASVPATLCTATLRAPSHRLSAVGVQAAAPASAALRLRPRNAAALHVLSAHPAVHAVLRRQTCSRRTQRVAPPQASASWLEELDAADGDIFEDDFEQTADDLPPLTASQVGRLEAAFALPKKQMSVKKLAGSLNLTREDVLLWMKLRRADPTMATTVTKKEKKKAAPRELPPQNQPRWEDRPQNQPRWEDEMMSDADDGRYRGGYNGRANEAPTSSRDERVRERTYAASGPGSYKWWDKDNFGARPMNKTTLHTLERVFAENRYPSEDMIKSVSMHTKLPRKRVLSWFQNKRKEAMADKYGPRPGDFPERKEKRRWY